MARRASLTRVIVVVCCFDGTVLGQAPDPGRNILGEWGAAPSPVEGLQECKRGSSDELCVRSPGGTRIVWKHPQFYSQIAGEGVFYLIKWRPTAMFALHFLPDAMATAFATSLGLLLTPFETTEHPPPFAQHIPFIINKSAV